MNFNEYQEKARSTAIYRKDPEDFDSIANRIIGIVNNHNTLVDVRSYRHRFSVEDCEEIIKEIYNLQKKYCDLFNLMYPVLGLIGETSEVAEKFKKCLRDDGGIMTDERREAIKGEISDVFWYIAETSSQLGLKLDDIVEFNIQKLQSRKERNVIKGDGSNR